MTLTRICWLYTCLLGLLLAGCQSGSPELASVQDEFDPEVGWPYADSLLLSYSNTNTAQPVELLYGLAVTEAYPYRNIWVQFLVEDPAGKQQHAKVEYVLAEADGTWNVSPSGGTVAFEAPLLQNIRFEQTGTYRIWVSHQMRTDTLVGVERIQLRVAPMPERAK